MHLSQLVLYLNWLPSAPLRLLTPHDAITPEFVAALGFDYRLQHV